MAVIEVEAPSGEFVEFEIAGEQPTPSEMKAIQGAMKGYVSDRQKTFDTETGIQSGMLRAVLSGAETASEEEKMLASAGFSKSDYTRDNRGRLALTPSGAKKTGLDTDRNVLIDEEGFSRYDFADLAGMAPELTLGIYGGVKGAAVGTTVAPGIGTLVGGAIGAGLGAGGGNLLEESIEGLFGVSQQTASEIADDTITEALWAGGAELAFGTPFLIYKAMAPSAKIAKEGGEQLERMGEAVTRKYQPTKRAMGISPLAAKLEQVSESVIGTSPRMLRNQKQMAADLAKYNAQIDEAAAAATEKVAGDYFLEAGAEAIKRPAFLEAEKKARGAILGQLNESVKTLTGSLRNNNQLDEQLFGLVNDSFKQFSEATTKKFALIDDVLGNAVGQADILPTNSLKELTDSLQSMHGSTAFADAGTQSAKSMADDLARSVSGLGEKASFSTLYRSREALAQRMYNSPQKFGKVYDMQKRMLGEIDNILTSSNIKVLADDIGAEFGDKGVKALMAASDSIPAAREFYTNGMKAFEKIEAATTGKNLVRALREGTEPSRLSGFGVSLVKNGDKSPLVNLKTALKDEAQYNSIRSEIGKEWLRTAFKNSGIDSVNPNNFNASGFSKALDDLGETGEELFGGQLSQVKTIAKRLENLPVAKIDQKLIDEAIASGIDQGVMNGLKQAADAAETFASLKKKTLLRKLANDDFGADEAVDLVMANNVKKKELSAIMKYFEGNDAALKTIRGAYLENMLDGVGATVNAKKLGELSARIASKDKNKKLDIVFGEEAGKEIRTFGRIMKTLSEDASTSDLVANSITVNFMSNLGRIARLFAFGKIFDGRKAMGQIEDAYRMSKGMSPQDRGNLMGTIVSGLFRPVPQASAQLMQEGAKNAAREVEAFSQTYGVNDKLSQIKVTPPSPASGIGQVDVTQPLSPNISPVAQDLRQQAAQNPAVAQALGINPATATLLGTGQP